MKQVACLHQLFQKRLVDALLRVPFGFHGGLRRGILPDSARLRIRHVAENVGDFEGLIRLHHIELGAHLVANGGITLFLTIGIETSFQFADVGQHEVIVRPNVGGSNLGVAPRLGGQGTEFRFGIPDFVLQVELLVHALLQRTHHAVKQGLDGRARRRERVFVHFFEFLGAGSQSQGNCTNYHDISFHSGILFLSQNLQNYFTN